MSDTKAFISHLTQFVQSKAVVKLSLSKTRDKSSPIRNIYVRPIVIKEHYVYQVSYRTATQDTVENMEEADLLDFVETSLSVTFYNAHLQATQGDYHLLQNKKGNSKLTIKNSQKASADLAHNKTKNRLVDTDAPYLKHLGITSETGNIHGTHQKKYKQISRYIELLDALIGSSNVQSVVDMGSGKGYLTFALYDFMYRKHKDIKVRGIESRPDLVQLCNNVAQQSSYNGLDFVEGNIADVVIDRTDMIIALHACDIATDMTIAKGVEAQAHYIVVAPCCHKQIRKAMQLGDSYYMKPILQHGIMLERQAEMITDGIRALILEAYGYRTKVFEFISSEHTGKNVMITAEYTGVKDPDAARQITEIKKAYGIDTHYLETMCPLEG